MFFTPPRHQPLGLVLKSLKLYGSIPTQGTGVTRDGRRFSVRYRGGWLTLTWDDISDEAEPLFQARVGPLYDGYISPRQVCSILGLILDPVPDDFDKGGSGHDLSGATTFWSQHAQLTHDDAAALLHALRALRPSVVLLHHHFGLDDEGNTVGPSGYVPCANFMNDDSMSDMFAIVAGPLTVREPPFLPRRDFDAYVQLRLGARNPAPRPPFDRIAVMDREYQLPPMPTSLFTGEFPVNDERRAGFVRDIVALLEKQCSASVNVISLVTGEVLRTERNEFTIFGNGVGSWCRAAGDRLLGYGSDKDTHQPSVGYRPAE